MTRKEMKWRIVVRNSRGFDMEKTKAANQVQSLDTLEKNVPGVKVRGF